MAIRFLDPKESGRVLDLVNKDPEFRLASKFFSRDILLIIGDSQCLIRAHDGVITEINLHPSFMNPWSFYIKGSVEAWDKFLLPVPPPFYSDLYGGVARKNFELGGDVEAAFAHFWALTRMLDILRDLQNERRD